MLQEDIGFLLHSWDTVSVGCHQLNWSWRSGSLRSRIQGEVSSPAPQGYCSGKQYHVTRLFKGEERNTGTAQFPRGCFYQGICSIYHLLGVAEIVLQRAALISSSLPRFPHVAFEQLAHLLKSVVSCGTFLILFTQAII